MNAFQHSAVLAALCLAILAIHAEAQTFALTSGCQVNFPPGGGAARVEQYNNWTQVCCTTGVKRIDASTDVYEGCCHDDVSLGSCPAAFNTGIFATNGTDCCRPEPARIAAATDYPPTSRDCYNKQFQGCCKAQGVADLATGKLFGSVKTYDTKMFQCCSTGTTQTWTSLTGASTSFVGDVDGAEDLIIPRTASSCSVYLRNVKGVTTRCTADSMCPGYKATGENRGKCCRRALAAGETTDNYNWQGAGTCYDPKYEGCCEAKTGGIDTTNVAVNNTEVIDLSSRKCCSIPMSNTGAVGAITSSSTGSQRYSVPIGQSCPCIADADCGTANYTCCAPTQAQAQSSLSQGRRLIQCSAGGPTNMSVSWSGTNGPRFAGCYGKCIPSGPAGGAANAYAMSCLNTLPNFATKCADLRVENSAAFGGGGYLGNPGQPQWITPSVDDLIKSETQFHTKDCCSSELGFSALFDTEQSICCPVMGLAPATGAFPLRLSPVILRSTLTGTYDANNLGSCLCNEDSHCQTGYKCCPNANSGRNDGADYTYTRPDGTTLNGLCINLNASACCQSATNPDTLSLASPLTAKAKIYDPTTQVCCPVGAPDGSGQVQSAGSIVPGAADDANGKCGCHVDADCPGEFGSCCTAAATFGSGTHQWGVCYDRRRQSCCAYHTVAGTDPLPNAIAAKAAVYDNTSRVCCPWGGLQTDISQCGCRSDVAATDCPGTWKCCAAQRTSYNGLTQYRANGKCFDPARNQGCCNYAVTRAPADTAVATYDLSKQVCCSVNGPQKDHRSCMCSADTHCPANGQCCLDAQATSAGAKIDCTDFTGSFANPSLSTTACPGKCIFKELETCCDDPTLSEFKNGNPVATCVSAYQKCCDGLCCNKATSTCKKANLNRGLSASYGYHYGLDTDAKACTVTEHSSPSIVFHTWVFPAFLSLASIVVILLGSRAGLTAEVGSNMHRLVLVGVQVFIAIMSILLLWSPLWKYGFGIIFANSFILHSFVVGGQWTRRIAVILIVVTFLWVYEPFGTNSILSFGTKTFQGGESIEIHGLNFAARTLQRGRTDISGDDVCTRFYMYWKTDAALHDSRKWNPQSTTRGICRRSWMHTITVMAGLILPFEAVWLFLASIALARASQATKDVKVQPIQA